MEVEDHKNYTVELENLKKRIKTDVSNTATK